MSDVSLLDLAQARLAEVVERADEPVLDAVLRRLFNPADHELLTVSAFASSL